VKLMMNNAGKNFKIYISKIENSFEMVIVDDEIVFIHFRKYSNKEPNTSSEKPISLISATLKIEKRLIANEFSTIFDSIKNNSKDIACTIDCSSIDTSNLSEVVEEYKKKFNDVVAEYDNEKEDKDA